MEIRFWGTRGSVPTPGPETVRYGGNTSCVEVVTSAGTRLVIDCGTGARPLGAQLMDEARRSGSPPSGHVLIGHTHWDHIHGLPFFAPLFEPGGRWSLYGPRGLGASLAETLAGQMQYAYFPVSLDQLVADVDYHDLVEGQFTIDDATITTHYLNHPALTLGFRIEADGWTIVYASDHEPYDRALGAGGDLSANRGDEAHLSFLAGADVLIHDAQYLASEYPQKVGWGHSTVEYVVDAARQADVGQLVLHHHDPARSDVAMDELVRDAHDRARAAGFTGTVDAAHEGASISLPARALADEPAAVTRRSAVSRPAVEALVDAAVLDVAPDAVAIVASAVAAEHLVVREHDDGDRSLLVIDDGAPGVERSAHRGPVLLVSRGGSARPPGVTDVIVWPSSVAHVRTKVRAAVLRRACRWEAAAAAPDEEQRLAALHALGLLDTRVEDRFDRLTALACDALAVPIALVTLVDRDRQWFKSRQGLTTTESHRDQSLCAHAILGEGVFEVPDLLLDPRFADSPAANGPDGVRAYAGVPLHTPAGRRVGTLCVADRRPRVFSDAQLSELRRLARLVEAELER